MTRKGMSKPVRAYLKERAAQKAEAKRERMQKIITWVGIGGMLAFTLIAFGWLCVQIFW